MLEVVHLTFVRLHLGYFVKAASLCFKYEANITERVQRQGTKMTKVLSGLSYENRLGNLNLFTLSCHRLRVDPILAYRIVNFGLSVLSFPTA